MLKIRLKRFGRKFDPIYRVVVVDARKQRDSKVISEIGFYETKKKQINLNIEDYEKYVRFGAQPTNVVKKILKIYKKNLKTI